MRILITGGAGFIGSHVCDAYHAAGHTVLAVDDLSTGRRENLDPRIELVERDIRDPSLADIVGEFRPDVVNHHAAQVSVTRSVEDPVFDAQVNVAGLANVVGAAVSSGAGRVIFSSTGGAIYGEPDRLPADENHPARPEAPYGVSKRCGELYLDYYGRAHGLDTVVLRYGNVYGPRQDPFGEAGVVAIFSKAMLEGRTPVIFGDGEQTRDFVYVGDVARANVAALTAPGGTLVNIGTGGPTSVNAIFDVLADLTRFEGEPRHDPARPGEVRHIHLDCARAQAVLGFEAGMDLRAGLEATVEYFRHVSRR